VSEHSSSPLPTRETLIPDVRRCLPEWYAAQFSSSGNILHSTHFNLAVWPVLTYDSEQGRHSLYEVFQSGLDHSPDGPCLGHRPLISSNPVTFAPTYVWETYRQVDERRRNLGSGLQFLWQEGRAGGGELPTVGIWSQNRPGSSLFLCFTLNASFRTFRVADYRFGRSSILQGHC